MKCDIAGVRPLQEIISGRWLPAGVAAVFELAPGGFYRRPAPLAIDAADLDRDQLPAVRGIYNVDAASQPFGPVCCAVLKGAFVAGQGSVVTRDGCVVRESVAEFVAHGDVPDGFVGDGAGGLRLSNPPCRRISGPVLLLKRPWWRNYGHWLIDSAAMLALATLRLPGPWQAMVGRQESPKMRRVVADTFSCLAPGAEALEHPDGEVWLCDELLYVSPLHVPPLFKHPDGLSTLRARILRRADGAAQPVRRLFVTRGGQGHRRLENEAELAALAVARGYEVVDPLDLDLAGQARLFRGAASVAGVKGAALANMLFSGAGTRCLVLSPGDFPDPFFWDLACHAGASYAELFGPLTGRGRARGHNSFTADPVRFAAMLPH